ncbi:site-specific integrase [Dehalococcoides mccartyi]|uniref:site-specific integrase n=2 Tax=Dehalococcoidaceae TaxID=1202464 RepID=UPI0033972D31
MHTLTEAEVHKVLETARETPYFALFYLALFTGLRRSELLALKWSDIDLNMGQLSISRSLHSLAGGKIIIRQTKTARSTRTVALSPSTVQVLKDHKCKQQAFKLLAGLHLNEDDFIFTNIDGKPLLPNTITHNWIKIIRKTGLNGIRLHDARHTHASLMLKQGVHPKIVQERLGHSSIQVTLDTYSHVTPGLQQAAAKGFDELIIIN